MSFLSRLNIFKKNFQQTHRQYNEFVLSNIAAGTGTLLVNTSEKQDYVDEGYRKNANVYSIINLIIKSAQNVPICVYKKKDRQALKQYKSLISGEFNDTAMMKAEVLKQRALEPAEDSDLAKVLNNPNPDMGYAQFISEVLGFKLITGDSYIQGIAPETGANRGKFKELYPLPAHLMEIVFGGLNNPIEGYRLRYFNYQVDRELPPDRVCHIKTFNPDYSVEGSHLYGQSPLEAAYRNLQINNDAITTGKRFLNNQGARGILTAQDMMLTEEQAQALKDKYRANYQGADNAGEILISSNDFKWIEMGLPAADLALIDQYNISKKDLCAAYNVPSILLNDTQASTFNNFREAKKYLYLQSVFPELIAIRDELNRWLVPAYGEDYYIDFDFMSVPELQEDLEKVTRSLSLSWWLTGNEKRQVQKYEPIDQKGMDDIFLLANYIPLSDGITTTEQGGTSEQVLGNTMDYEKK